MNANHERSPDTAAGTWDYIIVGAGSAGCVLANRLSADPAVSVALIEAGGSDRSWKIQMPTAMMEPLDDPRFDWGLSCQAEPFLDGRCPRFFRGRVLGGTSSINGMVYIRGHPRDFDRWAHEEGCRGWSWAEVLPYFRRAERFAGGADAWRGDAGPLHTRRPAMRNPLYRAFVRAGEEAGYGLSADINGHRREGFGAMDQTIHHGRRWNTANAYLRPALSRRNLAVLDGCEVTHVHFKGTRASLVEYRRGSMLRILAARREIILCAGAIHSPWLLQRSGIGDSRRLRAAGIPVVADRPGVGRNLQDHVESPVQYVCTRPYSLDRQLVPWRRAWIGLAWFLTRRGLGASNHFEACGFVRSRAGVEYPDIQFHFLPTTADYDGTTAPRPGFEALVDLLRPTSRGEVRLDTADPDDPPQILCNFLSTESDREDMRTAVRLAREIFQQPAFASLRGDELAPGASVQSDEALDAWIRTNAKPAYHATSSCRMGAVDAPESVLDPELRVIGIDGLRVVDASAMPSNVSGNPNASIIMLAERAADLIAGRAPLAPESADVWIHPRWRECQR